MQTDFHEMLYFCLFAYSRWTIDHSKPSGKIKLILCIDAFE